MTSCDTFRYSQTYCFDKCYENESNAALHTDKYNQNGLTKVSLSPNLTARLNEERFLHESGSNTSLDKF